MNVKEKAQKWLDSPLVDEETKNEIRDLMGDNKALEEAFYRDLEFGTGGLRGVMGAGTNRMNKYTVGMATQGLANYLQKKFPNQTVSVAIAHDSRNNSELFARTTADIFSANGIKVYLFPELRPTPMLSYAIRKLNCQSGVVITASHNPKEYNGYKAYWNDGGQLIAPHDKGVIDEVRKIETFEDVHMKPDASLIEILDEQMDDLYLEDLKSLQISADTPRDLKIVFSSIHGTGITMVPKALKKFGFDNVEVVKEQSNTDGNFPTVVYPNPEEQEAMKMALQQAEKSGADLIMATDPDADRVGIGVKNHKGEYQLLNGNQTAAILIYYLCAERKKQGLKGNEFIAKTIVTTELLADIAEKFGIKIYDTLTGFKYIADLIRQKEASEVFIGGGEESYGYLIGDFVRDKDAVASCVMIAEAAEWAQNQGMSVFELLLNIYKEFGLYQEALTSLTKKGKEGAQEISQMMSDFRENSPETLAGSKIKYLIDYQSSVKKDLITGKESLVSFPKSNVLQFITEDGTKVSLRPSGTEPKIKFYFSTNITLKETSDYDKKIKEITEKIEQLKQDLAGDF